MTSVAPRPGRLRFTKSEDRARTAFTGGDPADRQRTQKGARLIVRTFYRELHRSGWTDAGITADAMSRSAAWSQGFTVTG